MDQKSGYRLLLRPNILKNFLTLLPELNSVPKSKAIKHVGPIDTDFLKFAYDNTLKI